MLWPNNDPQKGHNWEIFFEPVVDSNRKPVPSTFVIVVTVAQCAGGVFTETPESYEVVNGKVKAIPFEVWKKRISLTVVSEEYSRSPGSSNIHR